MFIFTNIYFQRYILVREWEERGCRSLILPSLLCAYYCLWLMGQEEYSIKDDYYSWNVERALDYRLFMDPEEIISSNISKATTLYERTNLIQFKMSYCRYFINGMNIFHIIIQNTTQLRI